MVGGGRGSWLPAAGALALFALLGALRTARPPAAPSSLAVASRRRGGHTLKARSEYEDRLGVPIGDGLYDYEHLVELHRTTTLRLLDYDGDDVLWAVGGTDGGEGAAPGGAVLTVKFVEAGTHAVTATASDGFLLGSFGVTAKYVRRELRDLSAGDRERYFGALHAVYATSDADGARLYGSDFRSAHWFVREHLYGAAQRDCDHWHDDAGFLTHHVGVTMLLERSLQAVDATVASHYWDYTLDAARAQATGESYAAAYDGSIFGEGWFGSTNPSNSDHVVASGRWAYTPVMTAARSYSNITNPYGLLRSPWNTNPAPYVARYDRVLGVVHGQNHLPLCADFQAETIEGAQTIGRLFSALNSALHGSVHIMLGGHWGFDPLLTNSSKHYKALGWRSDQMLLGSKFLWRSGYVDCPEDCAGLAAENCTCTCGRRAAGPDGSPASASQFLVDTGFAAVVGTNILQKSEDALRGFENVADVLCHVGHAGEMFTSAAPQDPLFWPLHGLAERYLQLLRTWHRNGTFIMNETWGYVHSKGVLSDTELVCDWQGVSGEEMPNCTSPTTCDGHHAKDVLPFEWPVPPDVEGARATYTNEEFYELIAPWDVRMPYVYDKLSTWPACPGGQIQPHNGGASAA
jgi:hypothetical protein